MAFIMPNYARSGESPHTEYTLTRLSPARSRLIQPTG